MDKPTILVVEDEPIVAKDIQVTLQRMGYDVPTTASSGEEALKWIEDQPPELVLMDIVLKGHLDGIDTARQIQEHHQVPVVYLTAYGDNQTLERVKRTNPYGYIMKPYQSAQLRSSVETVLCRAQQDRLFRERLFWLSATVRSMEEGVIATTRGGRLIYMNHAAEALTGWTMGEVLGRKLAPVMAGAADWSSAEHDVRLMECMDLCHIVPLERLPVVSREGRLCYVHGQISPVIDDQRMVIGAVIVFSESPAPEPN